MIILTSNVGARLITEKHAFGFGAGDEETETAAARARTKENVMGELKKTFRPEFLNRVDDTIVFDRLTAADIEEIARRMIKTLDKRMSELELHLDVSDEAVAHLAKAGFDDVYGARPLRRAIQSELEDALAEKMLEGAFQAGDTVKVDVKENALTFEKEAV